MKTLAKLQLQFQQFLLSNPSTIHTAIKTTTALPQACLAIYKNAYDSTLNECLQIHFPMVRSYLGSSEFDSITKDYILAFPSRQRSIRWYGAEFATFLKDTGLTHLAELADFEWRLTLSFDAADALVLQVAEMAAVPASSWVKVKLIAHPSLQCVNYQWNAVSVWQALAKAQPIPPWSSSSHDKAWVLWRTSNFQVQFSSLTPAETWAITALVQGVSFPTLCEGLCEWFSSEEVGSQTASYLKAWIQKGFISKLEFNRE